jgi:peptide/nickel transport system substrate-binding protein
MIAQKEMEEMAKTFKLVTSSLVLVVILSMLLTACAPAATPTTAPVEPAKPTNTQAPAAPAETEAPVAPAPTEAPPTAEPPAPEDHTLTIAVSADIAGWDPATSIYWLANEVIINTHDTLVDYGPKTDDQGNPVRDITNVVPNLAESFENKDGKEFTFKLQPNAKFNNGDPVTAQAVKDSFVRVLGIPSLASFLLTDVAFVTSADQIEVVDEHTVKFTLPQPNPIFLKVLQEMNMVIVNVAEIKAKGGATDEDQQKWASANPTGSGPYMLEKYEAGVELVLTANPYYWGTPPYYNKVVYKIVPDVQNRLLLLRNGDVDVVYEAPLKDIETIRADPNLKAYATPTFGTLFWWVGSNVEPWSKKELRQALAYSIPYDTILKDVTYGYAIPATSWIPVGLEGHINASPYKYDLDKARELLATAGYPDGKGLPPITFYSKQGVPEEEQVAVYIQAELAKIGIQMDIQPVALAAHSEKLASHEPGLFAFNFWIPYVPDPVYSEYWNFKYSDSGCCNYGSYNNPTVDELITKGLTELDTAVRNSYVEEVQKIVADDVPSIPIYHPSWNLAMLAKVMGYSYYPDTLLRFAQLFEQ